MLVEQTKKRMYYRCMLCGFYYIRAHILPRGYVSPFISHLLLLMDILFGSCYFPWYLQVILLADTAYFYYFSMTTSHATFTLRIVRVLIDFFLTSLRNPTAALHLRNDSVVFVVITLYWAVQSELLCNRNISVPLCTTVHNLEWEGRNPQAWKKRT